MRSPGSWYAVSHAVTSRRVRARGLLRPILLLTLVALVIAAGCSTSPSSGSAATDTMTTSTAGGSAPEPSVTTTPTDKATQSAPGTALSWIQESPDPVDTATRTYRATAPDADSPVQLALPLQVPPGGTATVTSDRVLVRDPDGHFVVAVELLIDDVPSPTRGRRPVLADTDSGPVLVLEPGGPVTVRVRVCRQLVLETTWFKHRGTRSLRVTPTWVARGWFSGGDQVWAEVVKREPDADTPGMRDQLVCHVRFTPAKQAWFLEPDRPAVGYAATVLAACNPGDVADGNPGDVADGG